MTDLQAYCFASGEIGFGPAVPDGALPIAYGPAADIDRAIAGTARLAYDNETWLVPGIPEADNDDDRLSALKAFIWRASCRVAFLAAKALPMDGPAIAGGRP